MISIIVPAYNSEKTIRRCLDSILAQTYTDWECLVIDDGSTDDTPAICDEYAAADSRFRVFHKQNGGVSSARNVGLDNAIGQWVTFCDSDDWVFPCWLTNYMENLSPEYDVIIQGIKSTKPLGNKQRLSCGFDYSGNSSIAIDYMYDNDMLGFTVNKLFKASIINENKIRFNERLSFNEDGVFVIEYLSRAKKTCSTSKIGYYYYVPNWSAKYERYNNMEEYLSLCKNALITHNAVAFHFYINCCTEGIIDSFIKALNNRHNLLVNYYAIVKEYNRAGDIKDSANAKFNVFKLLVRIDPSAHITSRFLDFYINLSKILHKKN
jgi:glycosyltransferase involved in cell wall biosynthesis